MVQEISSPLKIAKRLSSKAIFLALRKVYSALKIARELSPKAIFLLEKLRLVLSRYYSSAKDRISSIIRKISLSRLFLIFTREAHLMKVLDTLILHLARLESLAFGVI